MSRIITPSTLAMTWRLARMRRAAGGGRAQSLAWATGLVLRDCCTAWQSKHLTRSGEVRSAARSRP